MNITLSIFVLCHNRADDARRAIASVLAQTDQDFQLVVSDNSSNDEVEHMVKADYPQVEYRRRRPMLPALEHFSCCVDEADGDYYCLFHDDDLMGPDYVRTIRAAARAYPQAVAIGCNAWTESIGRLQEHPHFQARGEYEIIRNARDLAYRYFARGQSGIAPFPGYVYRRELVGQTRLRGDAGKYSDATWLLELARKGPIVWVRTPLMTYRLHGGNDGMAESRRDRLRLLAYLKKYRRTWGAGLVEDYRCSFIYKPMVRPGGRATPARTQMAAAFLRRYRWARYLRLDTFQSLLRRAFVKWGPQT